MSGVSQAELNQEASQTALRSVVCTPSTHKLQTFERKSEGGGASPKVLSGSCMQVVCRGGGRVAAGRETSLEGSRFKVTPHSWMQDLPPASRPSGGLCHLLAILETRGRKDA